MKTHILNQRRSGVVNTTEARKFKHEPAGYQIQKSRQILDFKNKRKRQRIKRFDLQNLDTNFGSKIIRAQIEAENPITLGLNREKTPRFGLLILMLLAIIGRANADVEVVDNKMLLDFVDSFSSSPDQTKKNHQSQLNFSPVNPERETTKIILDHKSQQKRVSPIELPSYKTPDGLQVDSVFFDTNEQLTGTDVQLQRELISNGEIIQNIIIKDLAAPANQNIVDACYIDLLNSTKASIAFYTCNQCDIQFLGGSLSSAEIASLYFNPLHNGDLSLVPIMLPDGRNLTSVPVNAFFGKTPEVRGDQIPVNITVSQDPKETSVFTVFWTTSFGIDSQKFAFKAIGPDQYVITALGLSPTPSPSTSNTPRSFSRTPSRTRTTSISRSATITISFSPTKTITISVSPSPSITLVPVPTPTPTPTVTPPATNSISAQPSISTTPQQSPSITPQASESPQQSSSITPAATPLSTDSITAQPSTTPQESGTQTSINTTTRTATISPQLSTILAPTAPATNSTTPQPPLTSNLIILGISVGGVVLALFLMLALYRYYRRIKDSNAHQRLNEEVDLELAEITTKIQSPDQHKSFQLLLTELPKNQLTTLNLSDRHLTNKQLKALIKALKTNHSITTINLSNNKITNQGANYIILFLAGNKSIQTINLLGNDIDDHLLRQIDDLLLRNQQLQTEFVKLQQSITQIQSFNYQDAEFVVSQLNKSDQLNQHPLKITSITNHQGPGQTITCVTSVNGRRILQEIQITNDGNVSYKISNNSRPFASLPLLPQDLAAIKNLTINFTQILTTLKQSQFVQLDTKIKQQGGDQEFEQTTEGVIVTDSGIFIKQGTVTSPITPEQLDNLLAKAKQAELTLTTKQKDFISQLAEKAATQNGIATGDDIASLYSEILARLIVTDQELLDKAKADLAKQDSASIMARIFSSIKAPTMASRITENKLSSISEEVIYLSTMLLEAIFDDEEFAKKRQAINKDLANQLHSMLRIRMDLSAVKLIEDRPLTESEVKDESDSGAKQDELTNIQATNIIASELPAEISSLPTVMPETLLPDSNHSSLPQSGSIKKRIEEIEGANHRANKTPKAIKGLTIPITKQIDRLIRLLNILQQEEYQDIAEEISIAFYQQTNLTKGAHVQPQSLSLLIKNLTEVKENPDGDNFKEFRNRIKETGDVRSFLLNMSGSLGFQTLKRFNLLKIYNDITDEVVAAQANSDVVIANTYDLVANVIAGNSDNPEIGGFTDNFFEADFTTAIDSGLLQSSSSVIQAQEKAKSAEERLKLEIIDRICRHSTPQGLENIAQLLESSVVHERSDVISYRVSDARFNMDDVANDQDVASSSRPKDPKGAKTRKLITKDKKQDGQDEVGLDMNIEYQPLITPLLVRDAKLTTAIEEQEEASANVAMAINEEADSITTNAANVAKLKAGDVAKKDKPSNSPANVNRGRGHKRRGRGGRR